ncbi:non-ribosomal peptide synthetase domain-containing protein [Bacillus cereus]|nr:non-ribosomal peptide synthetase domain-containing protein [Bacillus cereus]
MLKFLNREFNEQEVKYIRFNYLGDFDNIIDKNQLNLNNIEFALNRDKNNSLTALMDIEAMVVNGALKINIIYSKNRFKDETIQKFIESYVNTLKLILDKCIGKDFKEFTPSDFDAVEISQEDLGALFN